MIDTTLQNVRYAARTLARTPLFATIAILSVALGVGATTAIVTLANTLLLRPAPGIGDPGRVVTLGRTQDGSGFDNMSYPNFADYRSAKSLSGVAAIRSEPEAASLAGPGGGEPIATQIVSGNFFEVLRARPALGRFFRVDEDVVPSANPVVVLSHRLWRDRFAASPRVLDSTITLNGAPFTVVGVAAERFQGPFVFSPDAWVPVMASPLFGKLSSDLFNQRGAVWLIAVGRLADGATLASAQAELGAIAARQLRDYPRVNEGKGVKVLPATFFPGDFNKLVAGFMAMLFVVAGLVLVIASTNVAGMLLARAMARQREIAVRLAIGGSRGQVIRQLLTESVLLFGIAGVAGVLLAKWLVMGLMSLVPRLPVQLGFDPTIDWRVVVFALGAAFVTGVGAGLVPALQTTNPELVPSLKSDGASGGKRRQRLRNGLLVTQVAFTMLLLVGAGLFTRALVKARNIDVGFNVAGLSITSVDFTLARYDSTGGTRLAHTLVERARTIPGVTNAAFTAVLPVCGCGMGLGGVRVEGREPPAGRDGWREDWNIVSPGYFETLGIPIVRGRAFTEADRAGSPEVAILNEKFAAELWPGADPIGKTFTNRSRTVTVVGIARNHANRGIGEPPRNFVYVPMGQHYRADSHLITRSAGGALPAGAMQRLVADVDRNLPILSQQTMEEFAATTLFPQRIAVWVAASLGVVALLLALLGIYGVTAYGVTQRRKEIGVRVALGAQRGHVLGLVLRQGFVLAGIGVSIGTLVGLVATRLLTSLLYGVAATDAFAFVGAGALLGIAALLASWVPAVRAARVDPVIALRSD